MYSKYACMCIFICMYLYNIHILDAIFVFLLVAKCVLACALFVSPSPLQQIFLPLESGIIMHSTFLYHCISIVHCLSWLFHPSGLWTLIFWFNFIRSTWSGIVLYVLHKKDAKGAQAFKPLLPQHKLHLKLVPTHLLNQPAWECLRVYRPKYNGVYSSVDWETMITTCLVCLAIDNHNIFTTCNAAATAQITGSKLPSENQFRASYGFWPTEKK